jgi:hypothetical protein
MHAVCLMRGRWQYSPSTDSDSVSECSWTASDRDTRDDVSDTALVVAASSFSTLLASAKVMPYTSSNDGKLPLLSTIPAAILTYKQLPPTPTSVTSGLRTLRATSSKPVRFSLQKRACVLM